MAREIFISYSRKDLDKVKAIKEEMEQTVGVECWMDLEGIESGSIQFPSVIVESINNCKVFLFMLSINSQSSKYALRELNYVMKKAETTKQKHVVIINIDGCTMCDEFDFMFGLVDAILWNDTSQHNKLIKDLTTWLGKKTQKELHSYGILMVREDESQLVYNVIKRTDPIIVEKTIYCGARQNQTAAEIDVYQSDSSENELEIGDCIHLFKKKLPWGFPVSIGTPFNLIFSRTSNGSVNVTVDIMDKRFTYNIL